MFATTAALLVTAAVAGCGPGDSPPAGQPNPAGASPGDDQHRGSGADMRSATDAGDAQGVDAASTTTMNTMSTDAGPASTSAEGSGEGPGEGPAPTFETLQFVINQAPCFGAGCHNDEQNPLDLRVDDELYSRLTSRISAECGDIPVVNPGNPQQSALVKILKQPCGQTPRMPLGCMNDGDGTCLPTEYVAAIEQWVAAGAPPR